MVRQAGEVLSRVILKWENGTAEELEARSKRPHFKMDLWKDVSKVVAVNQGAPWIRKKLKESEILEKRKLDSVGETITRWMASRSPDGQGFLNDNDILPLLAWYGDHTIIRSFIDHHRVDVNTKSKLFGLPLYSAAVAGHGKIVSLLLAKGANVNEKSGLWYPSNPLLAAIRHEQRPEIVEILLSAGADVNFQGDRNFQSPLIAAAERNAEGLIELLLKSDNVDVTLKDAQKRTILHHACERGLIATVRSLLGNEAIDANVLDGGSQTPLHVAINYDQANIVQLLLDKGVHINVFNLWTQSAPTWAKRRKAGCEATGKQVPRASEILLEYCNARGLLVDD